MRICYIVHSQSHFAAPYIDHFARLGHEIHLISFTRDPLPNAVNHHPLPHDCDPTKSPAAYVRAIPRVRRLVRAIAPDLVHAHFLTSNGLVATASGFHPLVVSARGSDVHNSLDARARRALIRWVVQRADLVNPVSAELTAKIATLGVPAEKILCLSQGIEAERFAAPRAPRRVDGAVRIVCTRKLHRPYQPAIIVAALARLAAAGLAFEMTFAAGGRDLAALRAEVAARGFADRVRFLDGYRPEALPGLLAESDVYVSASLWDGTSPALLEAMAAGVYPVVTDCPANREWLDGSGDGLLFPPDDVSALAAALERAVRSPEAWPAAAERNRMLVRARADRDTNLDVLGGHYERLVGEAGRRVGRVRVAGGGAASVVPAHGAG
ncbi:MAG: glycosyltransferase [Deltaproteobacteria bacterium]|nr:glycosyltransferase [Deltaproteobacteria bacterium]